MNGVNLTSFELALIIPMLCPLTTLFTSQLKRNVGERENNKETDVKFREGRSDDLKLTSPPEGALHGGEMTSFL